MKSCLGKIIYVIPLIGALVLGCLYYLLIRVIPYGDGVLEMPILQEKVQVIRDSEGIPHISAKNDRDAYRVLGYVMASERLLQMEMLRRVGSGTLSEIIGKKGLEIDKTFRTLGLVEHFRKSLKERPLPTEIKTKMESFFEGVNYFIEHEKLPIEFVLGGITPRKFDLYDSYAVVGYMAYSFAAFMRHDLLMDKLQRDLDEKLWNDLQVEPTRHSIMTAKIHGELKSIFQAFNDLNNSFGGFEGSNAWALSSKKTRSGRAMLASDPHIGFSLPGIWFEAHLKIEDPSNPYEIYGHFLPNIPFAVMGHDFKKAWGITISYLDDMDFYKEKFSASGNETIFDGRELPIERRLEVIKVRGGDDFQLPVRVTRNGPLLDEIIEDKGIALKWTYYLPDNHPIQGFYQMGRAQSFEDFQRGVSVVGSPGLNIIYADADDNIARLNLGRYPIRSELSDSRVVMDGSSKEDAYKGYYEFSQMPHNINPESGVIASANNRPLTADERFRGMWQPRDRFITILSRLMAKDKWSVEETMLLQTSVLNSEVEWVREQLIEEIDTANFSPLEMSALDELKNWDMQTFPNRVGASLYHQTLFQLKFNLFDELERDDALKYCGLSASWYAMQRMLKRENAKWWDYSKTTDKIETRKDILIKSFKDAVAILKNEYGDDISKWTWGRLHTLEFAHPLGKSFPLNKILNLGPYPVMGGYNNVNNFRQVGCKDGFQVKSGPSTRRIIDFSEPGKSYGILPLGISAHYLSPFFQNQRERFLSGKYRLQLLSKELIERSAATRLEITPHYKE
ncbi:putative secreted penicillin acylase [Halobacteriovorax marinus SJ]|uniref:Secreted penicillin acylase n=1 Tax=Halobacteriovorax marinus (strain ATCC BAA-682 / DSM 15412 / SJ) TaxID=862908 RepID=E1X354_HALMS|nr:penicillin acylase family protein [Halobacteriovorax marinus]CBW26884.1 putative secreted penicillin acylase [Halobacteriovorax marinus SJ]